MRFGVHAVAGRVKVVDSACTVYPYRKCTPRRTRSESNSMLQLIGYVWSLDNGNLGANTYYACTVYKSAKNTRGRGHSIPRFPVCVYYNDIGAAISLKSL